MKRKTVSLDEASQMAKVDEVAFMDCSVDSPTFAISVNPDALQHSTYFKILLAAPVGTSAMNASMVWSCTSTSAFVGKARRQCWEGDDMRMP